MITKKKIRAPTFAETNFHNEGNSKGSVCVFFVHPLLFPSGGVGQWLLSIP